MHGYEIRATKATESKRAAYYDRRAKTNISPHDIGRQHHQRSIPATTRTMTRRQRCGDDDGDGDGGGDVDGEGDVNDDAHDGDDTDRHGTTTTPQKNA